MLEHQIVDNDLIIDGVNVKNLAKEFGTPLYVVSYTRLKEQIQELKEHFQDKYDNVKVHYASKANLSLGLAKIMNANDFGLDVVSAGELYIAKCAGVNLKNIEFHGNNKTRESVSMGISYDIGYFVCDNEYELKLINDIAFEQNKVQDILFRLTPEVSGGAHDFINTGQKDSKFGIPICDDIFFKVFKDALKLKNINIKGIHFHVGSQLFENDAYLKAIDVAYNILKKIKEETGVEIEVLNIGGGFGINYITDDNAPKLSYYFEPVMNKIDEIINALDYKARPKIIIEPGRYLIGPTGFTLYEIGSITKIPGVRTYVGIDGGMCDNIRPALYDAKYHAIIANKASEECSEVVTIAGNCCESGDILIKDVKLPKIDSFDILCVFATGAYNYSMASNYNKNRIPAMLLIEKGNVQTLIKRQSYEQLIINDQDIVV